MRPATIYYLAQAWSPRTNHQFQREDARPSPAGRGRHARASRRGRLARGLPAVKRRILAVLSGTSQPA
jgi:hypothetical protein